MLYSNLSHKNHDCLMIHHKGTNLFDQVFHVPIRKISVHHIAHAISASVFKNAHLFRDKVEIDYKNHNKKLSVVPIRPARIYSHEFQQKFYFDVKEDIESHFAMGHGPGGAAANANKNAVILRHKRSGITIRSSKFRSLPDNRRFALNKIDVYLEYFLLGKHSRLGQIFEKQRHKYMYKIHKREVRHAQKTENEKRKLLIYEYFMRDKFLNKNHRNIEEHFLGETRSGAWQWILENGRESILEWILPIPESSSTGHSFISDSEFQRILSDKVGSRRLRLSVQSCLEVFGMYLGVPPGREHSQEHNEYVLLANIQNKKYWKYLIESRRQADDKLWNSLLDRLEHFGEYAQGQYAVLKRSLRDTIRSI